MWRPYEKDTDTLSRSKRSLFDYYLPLESVDGTFENYEEYLKAMTTLCLDFISDLKKLLEEPDIKRKEYLSFRYKKRFSKLRELREKSDDEADERFPITEFFDDLSDEEVTVLQLLFSMNGSGVVKTENPSLVGEEIIASLNILYDMKLKNSRKILMASSKLRERGYIGFLDRGDPELERGNVAISELAVSQILGSEEDRIKHLEEKREKSSFRHRSRKKRSVLTKTDSTYTFDDVILPDDMKESIKSVLDQYQQKDKFYDEWGMKEITGSKTGCSLLFSGQSGTGKSMMAQAIGNYLDSGVYYLAFDVLINSLYGRTEKNLKEVFRKVKEEECVLIIDEADGILSKRFSCKEAAGATENRIKSIFLREMEKHKGVILFTTNFSVEMDKALSRRFDLKVKFPEPNCEARKAIWESHIPSSLPLDDDVDFEKLARNYKITGGQIKNAVINSVRKAISAEKEKVSQEDFVYGLELEENSAMDYSLNEDHSKDKLKGYN